MEAPLQRPGWLNSGLMQLNSVFWLSLLSGCQWSGAKNSNSLFTWLDCKEIKLIYPKGNQSWIFMERTDSEAEVPILWPSDVKGWLIRKDPDSRKVWRQEKGMTEDETVGWHHWLDEHEFEQALGIGDGQGSLVCCSPWLQRVGHDWATELNWLMCSGSSNS